MRNSIVFWVGIALAAMITSFAARASAQIRTPYQLLDDEPDNVYVRPNLPPPDEKTNQGGVHFAIDTSYLSTYMYRGIDQSTPPKHNERALQFDAKLTFDLGKLPHPFFGLFSNIFNDDPVSRFHEVRPYAGVEWTIRPITLAGGFTGYIFPNREGVDTQEVWTRLTLDDSRFFHAEDPVFKPYFYGAYDLNKYKGFYLEAGVQHDFAFGESGVTFTVASDFAYVAHNRYFRPTDRPGGDSGVQHYDVGGILAYDLNTGLHVPDRFGIWKIKGLLYYTGPVESHLRADSRVWGGFSLNFSY